MKCGLKKKTWQQTILCHFFSGIGSDEWYARSEILTDSAGSGFSALHTKDKEHHVMHNDITYDKILNASASSNKYIL